MNKNVYVNQGGAIVELSSAFFTDVTTVSKWGNSQGIRLPKPVVEQLGIVVNDKLDVCIAGDSIILKKKSLKNKTFRERMEEFYQRPFDEIPMIETEEVDWGTPEGTEVW